MKLTVRCTSGLRIDFDGSIEELERFDGFLGELAKLERDRRAPAQVLTLAQEPAVRVADLTAEQLQRAGDIVGAAPPRRAKNPGSGRPATTEPVVLAAVADLGVTSTAAIVERTGLTTNAVQNVLYLAEVVSIDRSRLHVQPIVLGRPKLAPRTVRAAWIAAWWKRMDQRGARA